MKPLRFACCLHSVLSLAWLGSLGMASQMEAASSSLWPGLVRGLRWLGPVSDVSLSTWGPLAMQGLVLSGISLLSALSVWGLAVPESLLSVRHDVLHTRPWLRLLATWASVCWLLLLANAKSFPYSYWAWWAEPLLEGPVTHVVSFLCALWLLFRAGVLALALGGRAMRVWQAGGVVLRTMMLAIAGLALGGLGLMLARVPSESPPQGGRSPDLLVIGLDSLRRDMLLQASSDTLPVLTALRERSFMQSNVVVPLARTFPSWVSVLTGLPPTVSGARFNLASQAEIRTRASLAWQLKAAGYRTVFATDESRFSNIGKNFGFDQTILPKPGVADFLLGTVADHPLINFALQIPYMEWLLPSLVGNRSLAQSYRPERFVRRVVDALGVADERPTALFMHLCLAHWPYYSASMPPPGERGLSPYRNAIRELDRQLGKMLGELQRLGYLSDNTLVVVFADHGEETNAGPVAGQQTKRLADDLPGQVGGHGGSLLQPRQWQVFTLFSGHSALGPIPAGRSGQLASLADIAPAVSRLLNLPQVGSSTPAPMLDVVAATQGKGHWPSSGRSHVVMETGFRPEAFNPLAPDLGQALGIGLSTYEVVQDGRLEMRHDVMERSIARKDVGITDGHSVLVKTWGRDGGGALVELDVGGAWRKLAPGESARHAQLLQAACAEPEMASRISAWCSGPRAR